MLNKKEVNFYYKNGYVILDNKLDNKTLSNLKKSTKLLIEEYKKNKSSFIKNKKRNISKHGKMFLANRCEDYPLLESFVKSSLIKSICRDILGEKVYLFNEQVVNKEPQTDSKFAWHQDSGYVGHDHKPYLSIWIALCNTNEFNGAFNTDNELEVLRRPGIKPRPVEPQPEPIEPQEHVEPQIDTSNMTEFKYEDGTTKYVQNHQIINEGLNGFKGMKCHLGYESLSINASGDVYSRTGTLHVTGDADIDDAAVADSGVILEENFTGALTLTASMASDIISVTATNTLQANSAQRSAVVKFITRKWLG